MHLKKSKVKTYLKKILKETLFKLLEWIAPSCQKTLVGPIRRILIFEGGGIGDLLMLFPSVRALRMQFPEATVSFLISPCAQDVLRLYGPDDKFHEIIDYEPKGKHTSIFRKLQLIFEIRRRNFDLIYAPSRGEGMREVTLMAFLMGSPYTVGFKKGKIVTLHTTSIEFEEKSSILKQNLALLEKAGVKIKFPHIEITIPGEAAASAKNLIEEANKPTPHYVSIHPCADWNARYKCWPLKKYTELIERLIDSYGVSVILIGSEREASAGEEIIRFVKRSGIINTMGRTSIAEMASIIASTDLFIGNDSGPLHIALALNIPSIGLFGPTSPKQLIPPHGKCIVIRQEIPCAPCYTHQHSFGPSCHEPECMESISVSEVAAAAEKFLSEGVLTACE